MIWKRHRRPDLTEDKPLLGPVVFVPMVIVLTIALAIGIVAFT